MNNINFMEVKNAIRGYEDTILHYLLPHGKKDMEEYIALNPTRNDKKLGSFRINTRSWKWADFATGDKGGDIISLYAYLTRVNQAMAAKEILKIIGKDYE